MQFFHANNFSVAGAVQLPAGLDVVAVAIAPSSEVDLCLVGALPLGPGGIVPFADRVTAVRGYRSGAVGTADAPIATTLSLLLFGRCEPWFAPPGRPTRYYSGFASDFAAGESSAQRVARLPFSGRKQAAIAFKRADGDLLDATMVVRGVRYLSRERIAQDATQAPYRVQVVAGESLFDLTGTIPTSTLGGDTVRLGGEFYVGGGGDAQEMGLDELELWVHGDVGSGVFWTAEVSGEAG